MKIPFKTTLLSAVALTALTILPLKSFAADLKIGVINLQYALNNTDDGKASKASLQQEGDRKKKELELLENDLKKMQEDIQKQRAVLSETALKEKSEAFKQKYGDLQKKANDYETELKRKEVENVERILKGLRDIVNDIAAKEGYTLVLENSAGGVAYASASVKDITNDVVAAYNTRKKK